MTLNKTWTECLRMWKWIAKVWKPGDNVFSLKTQWLEEHGYENADIEEQCFFCEYSNMHFSNCALCPGRLVNKHLRLYWCQTKRRDWQYHPKVFYRKLVELNKKRLNR